VRPATTRRRARSSAKPASSAPEQSGAFTILNGSIVSPDAHRVDPQRGRAAQHHDRRATRPQAAPRDAELEDQVIPDDLIVQGSTCVGFDCVNNESFGFDTIRLKENSTRIKFEDTSVGSFPANDWQLTPTTRAAAAPTSSPSRTSPARRFRSRSPPERRRTRSSSTAPAASASAPRRRSSTSTSHQQHSGHPLEQTNGRRLHGPDLGRRGQRSELLRPRRDRRLAPAVPHPSRARRPARSTSAPNAATSASALAGTLTQGSSRAIKHGFATIDPANALAGVQKLPILTWVYNDDATQSLHVGPMAEEFHAAFGFGADDKHIAPSDQAGLALAAIKGLAQVVEQKDQKIQELEARLQQLEKQMASTPKN
jgi:hypothetical protein